MPESGHVAALVLAAGASRRFGADKLLQPLTLDGVTLPLGAHSLRPWLAMFDRVTVVVRPDRAGFCRVLETALEPGLRRGLHWLPCPDAASGMGHSLAAGVAANLHAAAWLVGLADMPLLPASAIAGVRDAMVAGAALAAPYCNERRGHPVGFAADYREELLALHGDSGARHLLERDSSRIARVDVAHSGIWADIDHATDLQHLNNLLRENLT